MRGGRGLCGVERVMWGEAELCGLGRVDVGVGYLMLGREGRERGKDARREEGKGSYR